MKAALWAAVHRKLVGGSLGALAVGADELNLLVSVTDSHSLSNANRTTVDALAALEPVIELAEREIANAESAIPLVEADSRLGWEPSMEYMTDAEHIRWKIAQVRTVVDSEFVAYRQSLALQREE